jgi:hypothetical protein
MARLYFAAPLARTRMTELDYRRTEVVSFRDQNAQGYPRWENGEVVLLPDNLYNAAVALFLTSEITVPFVIEFEYSLVDDDGSARDVGNPADGLTFMFLKNRAAYEVAGVVPPDGKEQGFIPDGTGYGVFFSIYGERRIDLKDGDGNILTSSQYFLSNATPEVHAHSAWQPVRIEVNRDNVSVDAGGQQVFSWHGELTGTFAGAGFGAASGGGDAAQKIRNIRLTMR